MWRHSSRCDNLENWDNFIASHTAALVQDWIKKKRALVSLGKNEWPTNSPDLNLLDYHMWGALLGLRQLTIIIETFELLKKKLCKVWFIITECSGHDCMFTWKSELYSLNCCMYWTTCVILIKFAGYLAWILICKSCKYGEKICYNSRDIEFFLRDYFFWRALYTSSMSTELQACTLSLCIWLLLTRVHMQNSLQPAWKYIATN